MHYCGLVTDCTDVVIPLIQVAAVQRFLCECGCVAVWVSVFTNIFVCSFHSAAFKPAHSVPDVFGRQMTPTHAGEDEHVLHEPSRQVLGTTA